MIRLVAALLLFLSFCIAPTQLYGRDIPPFVSTDWLQLNGANPGLIIIDARTGADYEKGHIPGSVNVPVNSWAANSGGLLRELPGDRDLIVLMGSTGIGEESKIVVVGKGVSDFDRADAVRVAWTILVAGVKNVSVLDGGFLKWRNEGKPLSVEPTAPRERKYTGKIDTSGLASKEYVLGRIGKSVLVDNRTPELFFGIATEPWTLQPGHIRGAVNLPTPWVFQENGLLRSAGELESMAKGVVGGDKTREIITYCGAGPYATVWSYILTELLGYENVKVYDGSMQEWIMDPAGPVEIHRWQ
ncbi:MAG TPA: rhodanese-like domain-containing protein [Acidobacteriota bacterium]|nr:rhodanese-like domain-containing protein [Acidobacteriota bacterium]